MLSAAGHSIRTTPTRPCLNSHLVLGRMDEPLELRVTSRRSSNVDMEKRTARLVVVASSAAGSSGQLSDNWLVPSEGRRRRSVAGIDQEVLLDPTMLADHDSLFYEFNGVHIHHKVCSGSEQVDQSDQLPKLSQLLENERMKAMLPMILLHGFGASVFSWSRVMKPLARLIGSKVLAFDRPAFGLTSRSRKFGQSSSGKSDAAGLNPYSMAFSVLAAFAFIDYLGSDKSILIGHSAGCLVAANAYFEAPERIAALILVAPAIFAPLTRGSLSNESKRGSDKQTGETGKSEAPSSQLATIWKVILRRVAGFGQVMMRIIKGVKNRARIILTKILSAILRSSIAMAMVRLVMDKFGIAGIKNSWYDSSKVTNHIIEGYTKPLKAKDWEMALLEYTLAMLVDSSSESKPPVTARLSEISCPVLVITGDTDRLVPAWNAKRLVAAIPGSTFEVIKNCGHLPHEERPEEFLEVVNKFLQRVVETKVLESI